MRLTLRTMLAYLDEILEPDDAADIGKKIEESEFATDLVRRTRDVIRRLRLSAPPLVGKGIALDPNTVAEYLDNTLSSERVPDFEKICLESDVHLAEVAACHQVLTLVLGEPAEIDQASRERMYALASAASQADRNVAAATVPSAPGPVAPVPGVSAPPVQAPPVAASVAAPPVDTTTVNKRQRPEVPDYLREKRSIFWPLAVALLILASVAATVGGGLFFFGPPEVQNFIASLGGRENPELPPTGPEQPGGEPAAPVPPEQGMPPLDGGPRVPPENGAPTGPGQPEPLPPVVGPTEPSTTPPAEGGPAPGKPLEFPKPARVEPPVEGGPPAPLPSDSPLPRLPGDPTAVGPAPVGPATAGPGTVPPPVVPPLPGQGTEIPPLDSPRVATLPKTPGIEPAVGPAPETAPASEGLGRYLTGQDVLLRYDRNDGTWRRLPANANVFAGDFLLALPTYSPSVSLSNGVVVRPIGPVQFELQKRDANGVPSVIIDYGRVVFMTVGKGAQVNVSMGAQAGGQLTFGDTDSIAAVEVRRMLPFGQNPETGQTALAAEVYAASGQIGWADANGETPLKAPAAKIVAAIPGVPTPAAGEIPKWISGDTLSDIEKRGTRDLEMLITTDRPVTLALKEQAESRRLEVRSLAIRCSAYVNQFDPFVSALNDAEQRGNWNSQIDTLRSALARGPEVAAAVRATFEKQRGEEGNELYRMLWGYSADQVPAEGFKLVRGLDHKSLDYRVLSFWNLQSLSGNSFAYKPADLPVKRAPAVLKWKERLEEGKLLAPVAPPAAPAKSAAAPPAAPPGTPPVAPQPGPVPAPQPQ